MVRIFGFDITRTRAPAAVAKAPRALSNVDDSRGWMTVWSGGGYSPWQMTQGFQLDLDLSSRRLQANWAVWGCQTLIAGDIGKLRMTLVERVDGVWLETESAYDRLFRKPNPFQTWQQFVEYWSLAKQRSGNAYVLLERDRATRVQAMYVLDPDCVTPLVAQTDGSVYYRLQADDLAGVPEGEVVVPASEILHDRFNTLFHPLVGLPPLYAGALAAASGLTIQEQSTKFFRNGSRPGGLLTTPGILPSAEMQRYKQEWETNFTGANAGRTAVLGNGLKYEPIRENAVDSELVAQLKLSAEMVCTVHHVPAYKIGVGTMPTYQNGELQNQTYYDDCLQKLIEAIEALLDDGLQLYDVDGRRLRAQFDLEGLLRMDGATQIKSLNEAVKGGWMSPNEARAKRGLKAVKGGEVPVMQQQNWPLDVLAERPPPSDAAPAPAPSEDKAAAGTTREVEGQGVWFPGGDRRVVGDEMMVRCWDGDGHETWVPDRMFLDRGDTLAYANRFIAHGYEPPLAQQQRRH